MTSETHRRSGPARLRHADPVVIEGVDEMVRQHVKGDETDELTSSTTGGAERLSPPNQVQHRETGLVIRADCRARGADQ